MPIRHVIRPPVGGHPPDPALLPDDPDALLARTLDRLAARVARARGGHKWATYERAKRQLRQLCDGATYDDAVRQLIARGGI